MGEIVIDGAGWVSRLCAERGLKQADLARLVGTTRQAVSQWDDGIYPTLASIWRLMAVLGGGAVVVMRDGARVRLSIIRGG